jgi:hypothetical protein
MNNSIKNNGTVIIAAFGCLGKTTFARNHKEIALDLESVRYSCIYKKKHPNDEYAKNDPDWILNPEYPRNYINDVIENIGKYKIIFVTLAEEILAGLDKHNIEYTIVYPRLSRKERIIQDAKDRGNNTNFTKMISELLSNNNEIERLKSNLKCKNYLIIDDDKYVSDYFRGKV